MKKIFVLFYIFILVNLYASGTYDPSSPIQDTIQLKIINLTDNEIEFFYSKYYYPSKILPKEFYITQQYPESYNNACFFIIKDMNGNANIYNFQDTDHFLSKNYEFHVAVFDNGIRILYSSLNEEYDYSDISLYSDFYTNSMWPKWEWNNIYKNISIINSSDYEIQVFINDAYSQRIDFYLKSGEFNVFKENQTLFRLRPIKVKQSNVNGNNDFNTFLIYDKWIDYEDINIVFKNTGYEIIYK